jgi:calcium/calmodulin-dependent protein kinase kinase 2
MASSCEEPVLVGNISKKEADHGILPSHGISMDVPGICESGRPPIVHHLYVHEMT